MAGEFGFRSERITMHWPFIWKMFGHLLWNRQYDGCHLVCCGCGEPKGNNVFDSILIVFSFRTISDTVGVFKLFYDKLNWFSFTFLWAAIFVLINILLFHCWLILHAILLKWHQWISVISMCIPLFGKWKFHPNTQFTIWNMSSDFTCKKKINSNWNKKKEWKKFKFLRIFLLFFALASVFVKLPPSI